MGSKLRELFAKQLLKGGAHRNRVASTQLCLPEMAAWSKRRAATSSMVPSSGAGGKEGGGAGAVC